MSKIHKIEFSWPRVAEFPIVAVDTETTGLKWYSDKLFGVSIAGFDPESGDMMSGYFDVREDASALKNLEYVITRKNSVCGHNIKFDALFLLAAGVKFDPGKLECTMVRAALINEWELSFSLDALSYKYLGQNKDNDIYQQLADLFGGKPTRSVQIKNLHLAPSSLVAPYATLDAELAAQLYHHQQLDIDTQMLDKVWGLERRLMPVLIDMERGGIHVDLNRAEASLQEVDNSVKARQHLLNKTIGKEVNFASPKQMRELFNVSRDSNNKWQGGGVELIETDLGSPCIDAEALRRMATIGNPIAQTILDLRKYTKCSSFLRDHIIGHAVDGKVYPNYNQCRTEKGQGVGTGRLSISGPALQQIPSRDKVVSKIVKGCFIPDNPKSEWLSLDYSQFEARIFAHYVNDPGTLRMYRENPNVDLHQAVADMTGLPRSASYSGQANAKQMNLGLIFGMGEGRLAAEMGLPYTTNAKGYLEPGEQARQVFEQYHRTIPGVKKVLKDASNIARSRGYVRTLMGRHLRFPRGDYVYKAGALVIQGTGADCIKLKMIEMHNLARQIGVRLLLSVHDSLSFSVPTELKNDLFTDKIKSEFTTFEDEIKFRVPITCDSGYGSDWYDSGH